MSNEASSADSRITFYEEICKSYHAYEDFHAKLLSFLPLASGAGIFFLLNTPFTSANQNISSIKMALGPIGFVGCFVTLGLLFFDVRALQLRANLAVIGTRIEKSLNAPGQFSNRPHSGLHIFNDTAGAIFVYFAIMAGWIYFGLAFTWPQGALPTAAAILGIGVVFIILIAVGATSSNIRAKVIGLAEPKQAPYLAIQSIKITTTSSLMDEIIQKVKNSVIPTFTKNPKFITSYALKMNEDEVYIISAFETQAAAEEATKRAADSVHLSLVCLAIEQDFVHTDELTTENG